jgi:hypothetical protein
MKDGNVRGMCCHQSVFMRYHGNVMMDCCNYENLGRGVNFRVLCVSHNIGLCASFFFNVSELHEKWQPFYHHQRLQYERGMNVNYIQS